jgi:DNA-binding response OmpR family regulator
VESRQVSETQTHVRPPEQPLLRVLVVDDNVDAAKALAMLLGYFHCDVEVAFDGESALAAAEHAEPHVGILDLGLPRIDGFELARRIRRLPWARRTMLIALSGWGQEEDRIRSREAGFDLHLVKPVDSQALLKILDTVRTELSPE